LTGLAVSGHDRAEVSTDTDDLFAVLDELERCIRLEHADLVPRLRVGLSDCKLDELAESLQPYYLPAELLTLYRWHDGWDSSMDDVYRHLLPDAQFDSLAEVIEKYEAWLSALGTDGWDPLWFPAFGGQSGELVALQLEPNQPAGQVFAFHSELDLATSYDSVRGLFETALDLWQRGLLPDDEAYPEIRRIAAEHNPASRTPDGGYRREISRFGTADWPAPWKQVVGIGPLIPAPDEDVVTIADFTRDPSSARPIRAELRGWGGTMDTFVATASDETGSVRVLLTRDDTENFREAEGGRSYELWLVPVVDRTQVDELARDMRGIAQLPAVPYIATRIVPLT